eukprot:1156973-Pelagomonas_calceolata.AAC.10
MDFGMDTTNIAEEAKRLMQSLAGWLGLGQDLRDLRVTVADGAGLSNDSGDQGRAAGWLWLGQDLRVTVADETRWLGQKQGGALAAGVLLSAGLQLKTPGWGGQVFVAMTGLLHCAHLSGGIPSLARECGQGSPVDSGICGSLFAYKPGTQDLSFTLLFMRAHARAHTHTHTHARMHAHICCSCSASRAWRRQPGGADPRGQRKSAAPCLTHERWEQEQ